jgi:hypothetical protein
MGPDLRYDPILRGEMICFPLREVHDEGFPASPIGDTCGPAVSRSRAR